VLPVGREAAGQGGARATEGGRGPVGPRGWERLGAHLGDLLELGVVSVIVKHVGD